MKLTTDELKKRGDKYYSNSKNTICKLMGLSPNCASNVYNGIYKEGRDYIVSEERVQNRLRYLEYELSKLKTKINNIKELM